MNILAIGAHYDDIEIGCGGSLLKFENAGHKIHMVIITNSEYSNYNGEPYRSAEQARCEGASVACGVGVSSIMCLDYTTKNVKCDTILIETLNIIMDRVLPDIIFTHWHGDMHKDHNEVARASLIAARHYPSILFYRSNWYHSPVTFNGRFYIDITTVIDKKAELLRLHKTEYERRGEEWVDFMKSRAREAGLRMGTQYAEEFEVFKYRMDIL
jgi:LmbE family N-acetylglucosaminyl deacetylase